MSFVVSHVIKEKVKKLKLGKGIGIITTMGVITMGLFGCSSETNQYSPDQVITNALDETSSPEAYYAEIEMNTEEKEREAEEMLMKEWRSKDGKSRIEMENKDGSNPSIAVNDGETLISYQVEQNQAFFINDPELLAFNQPSPKQQANSLLEMIHDTHDIRVEGEEEIAGRDAYHLIAKAKEDNTLFGDQELWIDKENWLVLKMISNTGDNQVEMIYTKVDFGLKIPSETFLLDLPDDVEMKNLEDFSERSEITLEEAVENIEKPFLYFPENEGLEIATIEMDELKGELQRIEVTIDYTQDDLPLLSMSVFESPEEEVEDDLEFPGEETLTIRNQEGSFTEMGDFRTLLWQENGLSYSIILIDPNLTLKGLQKLTDEMELVEQ